MFVLAPTLILNTVVTTLMMGTGLLTGFQRLELLSRYAIIYQVWILKNLFPTMGHCYDFHQFTTVKIAIFL
jgi:hypothetical protein